MNEDQREAWRKALTAKNAQQRRQRYRQRPRTLQAIQGAGMVRMLPPASERPAEAGRHTHRSIP
jgi:hypothetical protein